jgi:hypothetical protein
MQSITSEFYIMKAYWEYPEEYTGIMRFSESTVRPKEGPVRGAQCRCPGPATIPDPEVGITSVSKTGMGLTLINVGHPRALLETFAGGRAGQGPWALRTLWVIS